MDDASLQCRKKINVMVMLVVKTVMTDAMISTNKNDDSGG